MVKIFTNGVSGLFQVVKIVTAVGFCGRRMVNIFTGKRRMSGVQRLFSVPDARLSKR